MSGFGYQGDSGPPPHTAPQPQYPSTPPQYVAPPPAYVPTAKPPLPRRQRTAAMVSGIVYFPVISLGWWLMVGSVAAGATLAIFESVLTSSAGDLRGSGVADGFAQVRDAVLPFVLGAAVAGVLIWVLGLVLSRITLGAAGHPRPWAVTWLGLLIAAAASLVVDSIAVSLISAIFGAAIGARSGTMDSSLRSLGDFIAYTLGWSIGSTIAVVVAGLVIAVFSGLLGWRTMAWAFRAGPPSAEVAPVR